MSGISALAGIGAAQGGGVGLTVSAQPSVVTSIGQTSTSVTASPDGGTSPYVYQWVVGNGSISADTPTSASTTFSTSSQEIASTTAYCNVSDADGLNAKSNNVFIRLNFAGDGGGE